MHENTIRCCYKKIHPNHKPPTCLFFRRIHDGTHLGSGSKRDCGASRHTCPKGCIAGDNCRGSCRWCNAERKPCCRITSDCNPITTCSKSKRQDTMIVLVYQFGK